eukprot:m.9568 g.9568  ORF g.9568 m.9568 type:complete len:283 (+) comp3493_c0_seq2:125-973(+)
MVLILFICTCIEKRIILVLSSISLSLSRQLLPHPLHIICFQRIMESDRCDTCINHSDTNSEDGVLLSIWKSPRLPFVGMACFGVAGFALTFRKGYKTAQALAESELEGMPLQSHNLIVSSAKSTTPASSKVFKSLPNDGHALARRALLYASGLVALFGIATVAATSLILDVQSVPDFNDKVRPKVQKVAGVFRKGVQFTSDTMLPPRKRATKEEEEEGIEALQNIQQGNYDALQEKYGDSEEPHRFGEALVVNNRENEDDARNSNNNNSKNNSRQDDSVVIK